MTCLSHTLGHPQWVAQGLEGAVTLSKAAVPLVCVIEGQGTAQATGGLQGELVSRVKSQPSTSM